jgi:hypothetical protein
MDKGRKSVRTNTQVLKLARKKKTETRRLKREN